MKKLLFILMLMPIVILAQEKTVSGTVNFNGEPLPGVNIVEKGTTNGVTTDFNGNYEITTTTNAVLEISYIGFKKQEVTIGENATINIVMEEDAQQLDNVVVQGFAGVMGKSRKRTASIQTTPESVTAFNSDGIEKAGINNVANFANLVPNLKLSESQAIGVNSLVIRGIPQIRNSDAPVAFVIDGVTIADPSLLNQELFDLALIEVVKGPQGALYGKNAIGGAINIYSKEPTNTMQNKVTLGYGNGNAITGGLVSSGAVKKDKIFYRLSTQYKNFDGLLTNEFLDKKVDFRKEFTLRGQMMFKLSSQFKASVTAQYIDSKGGATYYSTNPSSADNDFFAVGLDYLNPNPEKGDNVISQDTFGDSEMQNFYTNLNLEYSLENVKLQSITSYNNVKRKTVGDLDFMQEFFLDQGETNDTKSFNQELRLTNRKTDTKFDWSLGGFYQNIERPFFQSDYFLSDEWAVTDYVATFKTLAVFGFFDYKLTDKLTASAGLRFDSDRFDLDDLLNDQTDEKKENVLQPKVSLSYQSTENVLLYANYGRGYRAGGFNPKVTPLFNRDFKGEFSDNYEVGFKTSSWNNRFILNGSVFFSDFTNRQQFAITGDDFTPGNFNYDKSTIVGFEFDTKTRVSKYLDILFNYGFVKSTITEGGSTGGESGTERDLNQFNDKNTSLVPQNNFNLGLASNIPFNEKTTLDFSVNYNGTGKIYWEDSNSADYTSDAYQLLDAQATLSINKIKLSLWARNILDKKYYLEYSESGFGWLGTPATVGTTFTFSF
ncbi:TonB-dependent receptor [Zobellia roscoffensis]|uniref:TonB-dependent receptor n=1 Tax=Zobellia roscoffensis TaxID=2779508 RepID=UPI00188C9B0C|nr:TonB-dependent receptor [Zobellia roscoffensis]